VDGLFDVPRLKCICYKLVRFVKEERETMAENSGFDVLIIGGGQAGIPLAHALAKAGRRVGLAERKYLGGSCVNFGCTPTKAVIASARVAHQARRATEFGLKIPSIEVDFASVLERAKRILMESRNDLQERLENSYNPKLLRGHARLEGRNGEHFRVRISGNVVTAAQVVLNTGTRSLIPPIEGLNQVDFIHAGNWLEKTKLPTHLVVIGGGYIGLEMSQFYRRMGSRVTVIEQSLQIAGHEDKDVAEALQKLLTDDGVEFELNAEVKRVEPRGSEVTLTIGRGDNAIAELRASHVFVATGRSPNTDDLGLETIGVKISDRGIVEVNERLAANIKGIWVAGDIRGGPMFTHTSWDDYRVLMSQLAGDGSRTTDRVVPYAIFTDPELGRVAMTERQAQETGRKFKVGRYDMKKNGKARELSETEGFVKVIVDAETEKILGAAVLATEGAELVHLYVDVMNADAPYTAIRDAVHIHPTLAEAVQSAVSEIK
jgi:pyruvate/2-oxoglutarate dehydrogenase complex dihydrolipoamide dehydrogenase (E3) component